MSDLTRRELAFIDQYFLCGLRGADAARRLGSKQPRQYAHRMLTNDNVLAEIDRRLARHKMSAAMILARLSDMAMSNIADFADISDIKDLKRYRHKSHVIKKFKKTVHHTKDNETFTTIELELYGADSALVNLGRHYKMFTDSIKVEDWRTELIELLKDGKITWQDIERELDPELVKEVYDFGGLQFVTGSQPQTQSAEVE